MTEQITTQDAPPLLMRNREAQRLADQVQAFIDRGGVVEEIPYGASTDLAVLSARARGADVDVSQIIKRMSEVPSAKQVAKEFGLAETHMLFLIANERRRRGSRATHGRVKV